MNERIQELKIQASKEVWGTNPYTGAPEIDGLELDAEKFAELIVRECATLAYDGPNGILEHFGLGVEK